MDQGIVSGLAGQFGPVGLIVGYLIWDRLTTGKDRLAFDRERLDADKSLASSLAALTVVIQQGQKNV